jgi:hypothetical protein
LFYLDSFNIYLNKKNKFTYFLFLLLVSLLTVYLPHGPIDLYEHNCEEILIYNDKKIFKVRKFFNKLITLIIKIFKFRQIVLNNVLKANFRLLLFKIIYSVVSMLHLLGFDFHGGKYKSGYCTLN